VASTRTPAEVYEEFFVPGMFAPCAGLLLAAAPPAAGHRVLDVACGTGVVARAAALLVGPEGAVTGVDVRPGMLAAAASTPAPEEPPIAWVEGDATALPFAGGSFDLVLCQQGLQFFPDRPAAAAELRRVLVPGGRAGIAVWQGFDRNDFFAAMAEVEARHLAQVGVDYGELAAPFALGDPEQLRVLLADAGFAEVRVEPRALTARFPAERFVENTEFAFSAVVPQFVADPASFDEFVAAVDHELRDVLARHREGDEIAFPLHVNLAVAAAGG
jgi:ubiquinone/menaquinone biosynthesis C-methylase UbiE